MRDFNRNNRSNDRRGGGNFNRPTMHGAVCDECGKKCEVPFKPTGSKPIFCSECFENNGESNSRRSSDRRSDSRSFDNRNFSRHDSREKQMFSVVCDECGKDCEVPFKPNSDKPVFCSDCFGNKNKEKGPRDNNKNNQFEQYFQTINEKLDQILQNLASSPSKSPSVKKKSVVKTVAKKKVVKKKPVVKVVKKIVKKSVKKAVKKSAKK